VIFTFQINANVDLHSYHNNVRGSLCCCCVCQRTTSTCVYVWCEQAHSCSRNSVLHQNTGQREIQFVEVKTSDRQLFPMAR